MDPNHSGKKRKINVEEEEVDRLSNLPDDLIHIILSYIGIKDAIGTSTLSSRWRFVWTSMSCLHFSCKDFYTLPKFSKFVTQFLSRRNNQIEISYLDLIYHGKVDQPLVGKILDYAYSHNIQQLNFSYDPQGYIEFPLSLFSYKSLKHLSFKTRGLRTTSTLELPVLTTLYLDCLTLGCDSFSKCPNLKNLTIDSCGTKEGKPLSICHPQLSNLTLQNGYFEDVSVVAPQLKNLVIRDWYKRNYVISAPNLTSLVCNGQLPVHLSIDGFHSLNKADICLNAPKIEDVHQLVCMFQKFHNVKFLTLNLEIVELLSSRVELISHQPSPFANLKSLTIYPRYLSQSRLPKEKESMSSEVKSYLLDSSPGVTFTMVSLEAGIALLEDSMVGWK